MSHITPRRSDVTRLPTTGGSPAEVARVVNSLIDGHHESHGAVTLAMGTTSTVIRSSIFSAHTILQLTPTSPEAAAVAWWQMDVDEKRSVTIGHDSPAGDVAFLWVAGG